MANSAKRPSSKSPKGKVSIFEDDGRLKVNLPRQYFGGIQVKKALGLAADDEGWAAAQRIAARMTLDLQEGCFDETLAKYGIKTHLKLVEPNSDGQPPKPQIGILELWERYCEYKEERVAKTTYQGSFQGSFGNAIKEAIESVGSDAIKVHNWLLNNRANRQAKRILSHLSHAYRLGIRQKLIDNNPFEGLADDIEVKKRKRTINQEDEIEEDCDVLDKRKAFTWDEATAILEYIQNRNSLKHWYPFVKFKFLTGCRTGEAIGIWWGDVKWNDECIVFRRSYSARCKIFKPTKNETERLFPMPKNGELWNLLKSIPQRKPNDVVFTSKHNQIIHEMVFRRTWRGGKTSKGVIPTLLEQGKLKKYLSPYNTRHTFVNHQINDIGIAPHIVNAWCEHSDNISRSHYRDIDLRIIPGYGTPDSTVTIKPSSSKLTELIELVSELTEEEKQSLKELLSH